MTALRSYSATCTFLRTTHKLRWRQSLFQEPSINTYLFYTCYCHVNGPLWGKNVPLLSPVSLFPWPGISFLHFCCSPYFHLATSNQTVRSKTNVSSPKKPFTIFSPTLPYDFLLHLHINNNYLYVSVTSILF